MSSAINHPLENSSASAIAQRGPDVNSIAQTALYICKLPARAVVEDVTVWGIDQEVNPL